MTTTVRAVQVCVRGRVQGVGFRWFAARAALECAVVGWVRNEQDGSVAIAARGERDAVARFLSAVQRGPAHGRVDSVEVEERPSTFLEGHAEFEIVR